MASGFLPVGTSAIGFSVLRSKIVTVDDWPSLTNPRPSSGANRNAMHARRVRDIADDTARIHVEHFDLSPMRNIEAAGGLIDSEVVPVSSAGDCDFLDEMIVVTRKSRRLLRAIPR